MKQKINLDKIIGGFNALFEKNCYNPVHCCALKLKSKKNMARCVGSVCKLEINKKKL